MAKGPVGPTQSIKDALVKAEQAAKDRGKPWDLNQVKLNGMLPPIDKMDNTLNMLPECEHLSLSTNVIERITNLGALKNLKILSLGRNNLKSLTGIEAAGETLEQLWLSYNYIDKLRGIGAMKKLRIFYLAYNLVKDWAEYARLNEVATLEEICFFGNPLALAFESPDDWREQAAKRAPRLRKIDGKPTGVAGPVVEH